MTLALHQKILQFRPCPHLQLGWLSHNIKMMSNRPPHIMGPISDCLFQLFLPCSWWALGVSELLVAFSMVPGSPAQAIRAKLKQHHQHQHSQICSSHFQSCCCHSNAAMAHTNYDLFPSLLLFMGDIWGLDNQGSQEFTLGKAVRCLQCCLIINKPVRINFKLISTTNNVIVNCISPLPNH